MSLLLTEGFMKTLSTGVTGSLVIASFLQQIRPSMLYGGFIKNSSGKQGVF